MNTEKSNDKVTSRVPKYLYLIISAITALLIGAYIITVFITRFSAIAFVMPFCAFTLACVAFFGYKVLPKWLKGVLCAGMSFFLATYIAFLSYSLATAASSKARLDALPEDEQLTVMIFGCYVRGEEPGRTLTTRLDAALSLLKRYPNADCIVSGGQGSNEAISEAEAMRRYLVSHGIDDGRITLEAASTNTSENLEYSYALLEGSESSTQVGGDSGAAQPSGGRFIGVSSEYHLPRIRMLSRALGREIETYPAYDANIGNTLIYTLREYMGVAKLWLGV